MLTAMLRIVISTKFEYFKVIYSGLSGSVKLSGDYTLNWYTNFRRKRNNKAGTINSIAFARVESQRIPLS